MKETRYKTFKRNRIKQTLDKLGYDGHSDMFFSAYNERRRTTFKIRIINNEIRLGYFAFKTHNIVDIEQCMLLNPAINDFISYLKKVVGYFRSSLLNNTIPLEVAITSCNNGLDVLFKSPIPISQQERQAILRLPKDVIRISWQCQNDDISVLKVITPPQITIDTQDIPFSPGSFLQVSNASQKAIIQFIKQHTNNKTKILDLFTGIGTYSIPLSKHSQIHAIENNREGLAYLAEVKNITIECRDLFRNPVKKKFIENFEFVIINPPRSGAQKQVKQLAKSKIKELILVYCDLKSFQRDSKILIKNNWYIKDIKAIDQFYQSYHMEILAYFVHKKYATTNN